jgi:plasmid stability protein
VKGVPRQQLIVNVPDELLAKFRLLAARDYRSLEGELLFIMQRAVAKLGRNRKPVVVSRLTSRDKLERNEPVLDELKQLYVAAGRPSTRTLADIVREQGGTLAHTTIHTVITGRTPTTWLTLERIVRALDGDVRHFKELWTAANGLD